MRQAIIAAVFLALLLGTAAIPGEAPGQSKTQRPPLPYCVVDTGQKAIFDDRGQLLRVPKPGEPFFGQDGFYQSAPPSYTLGSDGLTVYDNNTGLTWQRSPSLKGDGVFSRDKLTWAQARTRPAALNAAKFGGYRDWRLPTIKELYSLINFSGVDVAPGADASGLRPFIDTKYFKFAYGDVRAGERTIDSQWATSTLYVANANQMFGVNFADGRIKAYGTSMPGRPDKTFFVICVRGNRNYGKNDFHDNGDGTITDRATGLIWSKADSGKGMNWAAALAWVQAKNSEGYLDHNDWRLPNAKELQSIVDYSRSPGTTRSAAIAAIFHCTPITNEIGQADYAYYWTGTTHVGGAANGGAAVYIAFGRAVGWIPPRGPMGDPPERAGAPGGGPNARASGNYRLEDVHGAGAQRSDPKTGNPAAFPHGRGPQGDVIRIYNYVRLVRNVDPKSARLVEPDMTPLPVMPMSGGPGGGPEGPGGPRGGFHLVPPFAADKMSLTPDQQERIAELEKEARAKLDKILTPVQKKVLDEAHPPFPGGPSGRPGGSGPGRGWPGDRLPPPGEGKI